MTTIEKIRAKLENEMGEITYGIGEPKGVYQFCEELLSFLDTIEEPVCPYEGVKPNVEKCKRCCANCNVRVEEIACEEADEDETELNSLAYLEQLGYTCIPPKDEPKTKFDLERLREIAEPPQKGDIEKAEKRREERRKKKEETVCEELNEAAKQHSCYEEDCENTFYEPIVRNAFIAGAEWQKEQDQPITGNSLEQEWLRYVDKKKKEDGGGLPVLGEYGWLQIARHFANWQYQKDRGEFAKIKAKTWSEGFDACKEQFEKNRLAACDNQTKEEYDRETKFAVDFIEKNNRQPTFSDAINYGMQLQKSQDDDETTELLTIAHLQGMEQQKKQMDKELSEKIAAAYQLGRSDEREQMMKEAVEGEVMTNGFYPYEPRIVAPYPNCPYDFGDKVKLIIVKED